jgi:hypothetical protein
MRSNTVSELQTQIRGILRVASSFAARRNEKADPRGEVLYYADAAPKVSDVFTGKCEP